MVDAVEAGHHNPTLLSGADHVARRANDSEFWLKIGKDAAAEFADRRRWLYRRVESLEFVDDSMARRRVSIDFEIPEGLPSLGDRAAPNTWLVPISVFPKWPPLVGFNLVGPDELPASLYTRATNKRLDLGLVRGMANLALGAASQTNRSLPLPLLASLESLIDADLVVDEQLETVVSQLHRELREKLRAELEAEAEQGDVELARQIAATVDLAGQLSASSVLWVPVTGDPGTDTIVKFSYFDDCRVALRGWRRLAVACSWSMSNLAITLPHVGTRTRFHLDVTAPRGCVRMVSTNVTALPSAAVEPHDSGPTVTSVEKVTGRHSDEFVGAESGRQFLEYGPAVTLASSSDPDARRVLDAKAPRVTSAGIADRRAHIYLGAGAAPSHRVFVEIRLGTKREGFVTGCMLAALALAILMTAAFIGLDAAAAHLEPTVVLFSVVPLVLGYIVVRPEEGAIERIQIAGVRVLALIAGAMPIVGAFALVLTHLSRPVETMPPDLGVARPIWIGLLAVSWLAAIALFVSWRLAAEPQRSASER
ncbi:MAG TPA: hypothetical protein VHT25_01410 [Solirubrobacteraceae bacterium]|jgi:hypothetical protein|nr:hypothetical protein [Solirubrobacteraceae bacterium]